MANAAANKADSKSAAGITASFGSRTDIGNVREQNEDSLIVQAPLFVVADGMGGHAAGEVASEIAVRTIAECAPGSPDAEALGHAVEVANREIINAALNGEGREGMGTTCTAAILQGNRLVIAQVGDSRAYLLHNGKLLQLTRDHSLMANMIEAGQITPEEARYHPQRSVITRALGNDLEMIADLYEITVDDGDRVLLCSDGLTSMLLDSRIEGIMNQNPDPQQCASALVDEALAMGGLDNVTVVVADVETANRKTQRTRSARRTKRTVAIVLALLAILVAAAGWGGYTYLHQTAYIAQNDEGNVVVYRGVPGEVLGFSYSELVEATDIPVSDLNPAAAERIRNNMRVGSLDEALDLVESYRAQSKEKHPDASSSSSPAPASAEPADGASSQAPEYTETTVTVITTTENPPAGGSN